MRISIIKNKNKLLSIIFWIIIWHVFSRFINNPILLPRPIEVLITFIKLSKSKSFWISIFYSILRIGLGFLLGIVLGIFLGIVSYKNKILKHIIDLPMDIIRAIPIASLTIILLIWFKSSSLPMIIVLFMILPNIYYSTLDGLNGVDSKLLEMSKVFGVKREKVVKYIYLDGLKKTLSTSILISSGMAWKSGISAEVLALVGNSIGENIYYSKLYLDTRELFAWTFVIILLSKLFFLIWDYALRKVND